MAAPRLVTGTRWIGDQLHIETSAGELDWQGRIDWQVAEDVAPEYLVTPPCLFEPLCLANDRPCDCAIGARPHVVYAAFYGPLAKIGMTSARRLAERLREQGADGGFMVAKVADRGAARRLEKDIAFMHRIPEWRTHKEKLPQLARPIAWPKIQEAAATWRAKLAIHGEPGEFIRIDHPVDVLPARPHRIEVPGRHCGTVLGVKGPYLFYRPADAAGRLAVGQAPVLALKHTDLVGRTVTA